MTGTVVMAYIVMAFLVMAGTVVGLREILWTGAYALAMAR